MKCPACKNDLVYLNFIVGKDNVTNRYNCSKCDCIYELRSKGGKYVGWWKTYKLPVLPDDRDAEYRLYEIDCVGDAGVVNSYPLSEFIKQQERFSYMSSGYMDGEDYILVIAREDEFDEEGFPTFDEDERVLCYQGDHGEGHHEKAAINVKRWRDVLGV